MTGNMHILSLYIISIYYSNNSRVAEIQKLTMSRLSKLLFTRV